MASNTVTTHRAPKKTVTATRTAVTLATATVGSIALVPAMAQADPAANVKDVKAKVDALHDQAEQATEQYNEANGNLTSLQNKINQLQGKITLEQGSLSAAQSSLGSLAAAQYKAGGVDNTLQLMLDTSPDAYLQQASALAQISTTSASSVASAQEVNRQLQQDKATAADDLSSLQKTRDLMAAQKKDIEDKQHAAQALLDSLTPSQQVQYKQAAQASTSSVTKQQISGLPPALNPRAATAVAYAKAQIGKPYVWGAAGPNSFDCSGLVMAAWAKAGVSMSHGSRDQYASFPHVSKDQLQPGDLVFFYGDRHHVGMYIGNGLIIHAANYGTPVQIVSIDLMPNNGYARP